MTTVEDTQVQHQLARTVANIAVHGTSFPSILFGIYYFLFPARGDVNMEGGKYVNRVTTKPSNLNRSISERIKKATVLSRDRCKRVRINCCSVIVLFSSSVAFCASSTLCSLCSRCLQISKREAAKVMDSSGSIFPTLLSGTEGERELNVSIPEEW